MIESNYHNSAVALFSEIDCPLLSSANTLSLLIRVTYPLLFNQFLESLAFAIFNQVDPALS